MNTHIPYYPMWLRRILLSRYPATRHHMSWSAVENWQRIDPKFTLDDKWRPLPWYVGMAALGPLAPAWKHLATWIGRGAPGYSHRCEFTDKHGALCGDQEGPYMNTLFEQFIANISEIEE